MGPGRGLYHRRALATLLGGAAALGLFGRPAVPGDRARSGLRSGPGPRQRSAGVGRRVLARSLCWWLPAARAASGGAAGGGRGASSDGREALVAVAKPKTYAAAAKKVEQPRNEAGSARPSKETVAVVETGDRGLFKKKRDRIQH